MCLNLELRLNLRRFFAKLQRSLRIQCNLENLVVRKVLVVILAIELILLKVRNRYYIDTEETIVTEDILLRTKLIFAT